MSEPKKDSYLPFPWMTVPSVSSQVSCESLARVLVNKALASTQQEDGKDLKWETWNYVSWICTTCLGPNKVISIPFPPWRTVSPVWLVLIFKIFKTLLASLFRCGNILYRVQVSCLIQAFGNDSWYSVLFAHYLYKYIIWNAILVLPNEMQLLPDHVSSIWVT